MKRVFFGGSRKLGKLNNAIRGRTDNIMSNGFLVLLGDAPGADRAMQAYLAKKTYPHVLVFCAGNTCRNNIGRWETRFVLVDRSQKDFQYYAVRDRKMSEEADYGFMLWDGKSKGTLNNIINLLEQNKSVLVYFSPNGEFFTLKSHRDLVDLLSLCDPGALEQLEKSLRLSQRVHAGQSRLNFA